MPEVTERYDEEARQRAGLDRIKIVGAFSASGNDARHAGRASNVCAG
jgi:hypothetical protein